MSVRLMCENLIDPANLTSQLVSSEQTSFPATNIYAKRRRSKVWRSNGYWEITSSNNVLIFRETAGVDLTATVAVLNYSSDTAFFAAIKTALQAVGVAIYTVSRDATTGKIKILSSLSGGATVFELRSSNVLSTLSSVIGYDTSTVQTGAAFYLADVLKIHTKEFIRWDLGLSTNPKAFILVGIRNSNIKISPSATITLKGNGTDVWTSPAFSQVLTYNDNAIFVMSSTGLHSSALRYWRLEIVDQSNANGYVEISSIYLGNFYEPSRGRVQFPFDSKFVDRSSLVFSESGQPFSDSKEKTQEFSINWSALEYADIEKINTFFNSLGVSYAWFIILDPGAAFSSLSNYYLRMLRFLDPPNFTLESPNNFSLKMTTREEL